MSAAPGPGKGTRENLRQTVHIFYGLLALTLRFLPPAGAVALAAAALLHNLLVLPWWGKGLLRDSDRRAPGGIHFYPAAVLLAVVVFLRRPELAAAAWGVLAFGDGFATLAGRHLGGPRLPWNPHKSVAGSLAYLVAGTVGAAALLAFVSGRPGADALPPGAALTAAFLAALTGALVESAPLALDDNATTPLPVLAVLAAWAAADPSLLAERLPEIAGRLLPAAAAGGLLATLAWRTRAVDGSGAVGGLAIAMVTWGFGGGGAFALLAMFVVLGSGATRFGRAAKEARGLAQERGGRRSLRHVLANTAVPAAMAILSSLVADPAPYRLALAGGLATAALDTVSSEVGKVRGRRPLLLPSLKRVPPGTAGAVSTVGTLAGIAAAAVVAGLGAGLGFFSPPRVPIVLGAALAGGLVESVAGGSLGRRGLLGHETLNLLNTSVGAGLCLAFGRGAGP